jgi:hypothetical protein
MRGREIYAVVLEIPVVSVIYRGSNVHQLMNNSRLWATTIQPWCLPSELHLDSSSHSEPCLKKGISQFAMSRILGFTRVSCKEKVWGNAISDRTNLDRPTSGQGETGVQLE